MTVRNSAYGAHGHYSIYLPAGYGQDPRRRHPVVYLLHGGSDSDSLFLELGAWEVMDRGVRSGTIGPMILVMVDGGLTSPATAACRCASATTSSPN